MSQGVDDVMSIAYDWVARVLYFVVTDENQMLNIWSLPLDNPLFEVVYSGLVLSNDSNIFMTIAPFTRYSNDHNSYCNICVAYYRHLYWIESNPSVTSLYQLNLLNGSSTQLYQSNSRKRNVMCSQSGLDSIGELTAALTYDVITDRLWVSNTEGEIWSCDLNGCNCSIEVEGVALLNATNVTALSDIGVYLEY